jgi:hypothetical protein
MHSISKDEMKIYLSRSISSYNRDRKEGEPPSFNRNKLNGILAEIDFRKYISAIGFSDRISIGGWIVRKVREDFGHNTIAFFAQQVESDIEYSLTDQFPLPPQGLHTICSTLHQIGIRSYYCVPRILSNNPEDIQWYSKQLGIPVSNEYSLFPNSIEDLFIKRTKNYNWLNHHCNVDELPELAINDQFTKENIRIAFQNKFFCEISDIDGILWGNQFTYPIEIKEKTVTRDDNLGEWFGIDIGPFVKLAFYAAKKGNLHSLFIVREIKDKNTRELKDWWYITFDQMAQYASWIFQSGGRNMSGGMSSVVKIPKNEFKKLDKESIEEL